MTNTPSLLRLSWFLNGKSCIQVQSWASQGSWPFYFNIWTTKESLQIGGVFLCSFPLSPPHLQLCDAFWVLCHKTKDYLDAHGNFWGFCKQMQRNASRLRKLAFALESGLFSFENECLCPWSLRWHKECCWIFVWVTSLENCGNSFPSIPITARVWVAAHSFGCANPNSLS